MYLGVGFVSLTAWRQTRSEEIFETILVSSFGKITDFLCSNRNSFLCLASRRRPNPRPAHSPQCPRGMALVQGGDTADEGQSQSNKTWNKTVAQFAVSLLYCDVDETSACTLRREVNVKSVTSLMA